jgi:excisionase family DNA binding protein
MERIWETAAQIAERYKLAMPTIRLWTRKGMPHLRVGKRLVRFDPAAVQAWIEQRTDRERSNEASQSQIPEESTVGGSVG